MAGIKRPTEEPFFLTPQAEGWAVWRGVQRQHIAPTLGEAAALVPATAAFQLALPCYPLIMERLRLPATEREELEGMVQLQWEKASPFPPEQLTGGFTVLEATGGSSIVWSVAVAQPSLQDFSEPWSKLGRWPRRVAPYICHVAAQCPEKETVLVLYAEPGHWVLAVVEDRRPGWVHVISRSDETRFAAEFPSLLLTAGLEGAPTSYSRVLVAAETAECEETLRTALGVPVARLPLVTPSATLEIDLTPASWHTDAHQRQRGQLRRRQLLMAGAACLALIAAAGIDLALLQRKAARLDAELMAERPNLAAMQARQNRSNALAAAIDPHHYAIEMLYLLQRCLPSASVQFTEFEQLPQEWRVVGEAPSAGQAIEYLARLKHEPELSANQITSDPPRLLPNERAQFQVVGKP